MPKRAASSPFVFVGAGDYGQHTVDDAPGYKKGAKGPLRTGIVTMQAEVKGGPLREVGFYKGPEFGWIAYNPVNKCLYAVSSDCCLHAFKISASGTLTEVSRADTLGSS